MPHPGTRTGRRADAEQNTAKILDAAAACLCRSTTASMAEIAQAAGLGRVTVYGHFPSREALIEATLVRLLERGEAVLGSLDLTGDPRQALRTLVESSWRLIADADAVLQAAQSVLPPGRIRELHASRPSGSRSSSVAARPTGPSAPTCQRAGSSASSTTSLKGQRPTSAAAASTRRTPRTSSSRPCSPPTQLPTNPSHCLRPRFCPHHQHRAPTEAAT